MKDRLSNNWSTALSDVFASAFGTVGIVFLISFLISLNSDENAKDIFFAYFSAGQIGLPILSISGVVFITLLNHGPIHKFVSVFLYLVLLVPIIVTSFIVGQNPGFQNNVLSNSTLLILWIIFICMHAIWFFFLLLEPTTIPSAQEAGEAEDGRVERIKRGAVGRG